MAEEGTKNFVFSLSPNALQVERDDGILAPLPRGSVNHTVDSVIFREEEVDGVNTITMKAPDDGVPQSYTLSLPPDDGSAGQFLSTDGSGTTSWVAGGVGDVTATANMTADMVLVGDDGAKGIKDSLIELFDGVNFGGVGEIVLDQNFANGTKYGYNSEHGAGGRCTSYGEGSGQNQVSAPFGFDNTAIGYNALNLLSSGGSNNIGLGSGAGSSNLSGDGCIHIGNVGADESDKIRIGTAQTNTFIKGIHGVTPAGATQTVIIDADGELGSTASALGDVTAAANLTANTLIVGDGGVKGVKDSTITVTNDDELGAVQEVNLLQDSDNNTWYGYRAMNSKAGLTNSVAIGEDSMLNAPGITNCVAVGVETLQSSIDASDCVAIGYRAAFGNGSIDGDGIIAIGSRALEAIDFDNSDYTVAIGHLAASNATRVDRCIFIGYENANDIVSGTDNISLGYRALRTPLADGTEDMEDNIAIGRQALENLSQAASGPTNNIAIGNLAGNSLTTDDSDNICVANPAFAGDSGVIRIGTNATHTSTFIQGIHNVTPAGATETVIIDANGELGSIAHYPQYISSHYDTTLQTNTLNSFLPPTTTAIDEDTPLLLVGKYELRVSYGWNHDSTSNDFQSRLTFDGVLLGDALGQGFVHKQEPADSGGGGGGGTGTNQMHGWSQTFIVDVAVAGVKTVLLEFNSQDAGVESSIWNKSYVLYRIE